jgi:cytochrome c
MDSFELNKILGAILGTLLFVMGIGFVAEAIYAPRASGPGYALAGAAEETGPNGPAAPVAVADIGTLLAKADPKAGEAAAKKCSSCHDFTENGPNKIGPNLYGVVGRPIASHPGFAYSDDLKKLGGDWTYEKLNDWLISPKAMAAGTKMGFAGDKDDADRANIIAYLSTLSHSPVPFPAPAAASSAEPAASAASEGAPAAASAASTSSSASSAVVSAASEEPSSSAPASSMPPASSYASSMAASSSAQ